MNKLTVTAVLALLLAGCGAPRPRIAVRCPDAPGSSQEPVLPGRVYRLDQSRSELRVLVYRAGPLARFGHNHVLVNRSLCGAAGVPQTPGDPVFWLTVPAARFVVDDRAARSEEGADFAAAVPEDAKAGTLEHLLGPSVLAADGFPAITVRGDNRAGTAGIETANAPRVMKVTVSVAGHQSSLDVPVTLEFDAGHLLASGSLDVRQTALGLTPYSLMLGALQVQDSVTIKFRIAASPVAEPRQ